MGKLIKARPKNDGLFVRAMRSGTPEQRAAVLNTATLKLAEYRDANEGLRRENSRLQMLLDAMMRKYAEATGQDYPPKQPEASAQ